MKKGCRRIVIGCCLALAIGLAGVAALRAYRQSRLNAALLGAVQRNDAAQVAALLAKGADGDAMEPERVSLLTRLKELLSGKGAGPRRNGLDVAASVMLPPDLMESTRQEELTGPWYRDNAHIVDLLMEHGAVARGSRSAGQIVSPILRAQVDRPLTLRALLRHGARINASTFPPGEHDYLVLLAIDHLPDQDVKALLDAGADPNGTFVGTGDALSPLHLAITEDRIDLVDMLLRHGADPTAGPGPSAIATLKEWIQFKPYDERFVERAQGVLREMYHIAAEKAKRKPYGAALPKGSS